ncbi:hypothetical protein BCD64_00095 [Nostoc sp. MBR 210]|nr:hypothetical protein BCD64_00095 [Nostoc sp. MBR 210]
MEGIKFVTTEDVKEMLDGLSQQEKEAILAEQLKKLPHEAKLRVLGLSESGLTVITGSFVSLNSDIAINVQNSSNLDPVQLMNALAEYRKAQREKGT